LVPVRPSTAGHRAHYSARLGPNPPGAHFLTDRRLIGQLVRASGVGDGDLVFDLGAGYGALTGPLAGTGARVIAVELDPALAGRLRRRFGDQPLVGVVEADLRRIPLPRRAFYVVASPPFALTTFLCRRLLGDPEVRLAGAELLLEWGAAKWLAGPQSAGPQSAGPRPRDPQQAAPRPTDPQQGGPQSVGPRQSARQGDRLAAAWTARYDIRLVRRVPAASFSPAPSADVGYVRIRPVKSQSRTARR
jgi:23S rRNA (adenine-N6)-dimethyltransferase